MKVLLLYATYSSGTQTAASIIEKVLKEKHEVTVKQVIETTPDILKDFEAIVLGSPSWDYEGKEGQPHHDFIQFISTTPDNAFTGKKCAIFGLGDSTFTYFCGAVDQLTEYVKQKGGTIVGDPLRIDNFVVDQNNKQTLIEQWAKSIQAIF